MQIYFVVEHLRIYVTLYWILNKLFLRSDSIVKDLSVFTIMLGCLLLNSFDPFCAHVRIRQPNTRSFWFRTMVWICLCRRIWVVSCFNSWSDVYQHHFYLLCKIFYCLTFWLHNTANCLTSAFSKAPFFYVLQCKVSSIYPVLHCTIFLLCSFCFDFQLFGRLIWTMIAHARIYTALCPGQDDVPIFWRNDHFFFFNHHVVYISSFMITIYIQ